MLLEIDSLLQEESQKGSFLPKGKFYFRIQTIIEVYGSWKLQI